MEKDCSVTGVSFENAGDIETPCFIIHNDELKDNIRNFKCALDRYFNKNILAYSVKTNPLPYVLSFACRNGCFAEVVSYDEYALALRSGFNKSEIVYNGLLKSKSTFLEALKAGAYINIEDFREIEWLLELPKDRIYNIGIRLNIDLSVLSVDNTCDKERSRFGFSFENGEFSKAIRMIEGAGLRVNGIHVHHTSHTRGLDVYREIVSYANKVISSLHLEIEYFDIGGGYFGNMPGKPEYADYIKVIYDTLDNKDVVLIVEPGNGIIASPVDYVLSILGTKTLGDDIICSTDGSRIDIDPLFHKDMYQYKIIGDIPGESVGRQVLAGCTCLEYDKITVLNNEHRLVAGNRIVFKWLGAYTMAFTPNFIRLLPNVYSCESGKFIKIRDRWTVNEWIQKSTFAYLDKPTLLFTNVGRRGRLMTDFRESIGATATIMATDNWSFAPALFKADKYCLMPKISDASYIDELLRVCRENNVKAVTPLTDPEIEILSHNAKTLKKAGVLPLCPSEKTARLCFDKYEMFLYLKRCGIRTVLTFDNIDTFKRAFNSGEISFPVFIKPRTGSGSVGAEKIGSLDELEEKISEGEFDYIIQEFMDCGDCDADVYVDAISHEAVAVFSKRKIETRIGGASKAISFIDPKLFDFINEIIKHFEFSGGIDMDFFCRNGEYYLSEINPRIGGAYLHAYGAGVDFPKYIEKNMRGIRNTPEIGNYREGVAMMMYDDVVITDIGNLDQGHLE